MDWDIFVRYGPKMLEGLGLTMLIVVCSLSLGFLFALPLAIMRIFRWPVLSGFAFSFIYVFRGTPLLAQLFLVYYGAPQFQDQLKAIGLWWIFKDSFSAVLFTFSLNTAAYQAEILRGVFLGIPAEQWYAAKVLGLRPMPTFFLIILPQALTAAIRPMGNEVVLMIKASAVASIVALQDLMGVTRRAYSRTYDFQIYLMAAVMYLIVVETFRRLWERLEHNLTSYRRR